jgi:hypothetical protein
MKNDNRLLLLYCLAVIKFILPFFLQHPDYQPHRDEFLYLAEGNHMAWGFLEVPPLLSVFAWLTQFLGDTMFWIKFWPSLFGAFTYILCGHIILSLNGKYFSLFLGFLPFVFGAYVRVHFLFQPNFLEIFFYTAISYAIIRFIQTQKNIYLYIFGISCGLGMMSKYSVAFFIISLLAGLLLSSKRKIFLNKHLYLASILGFIIFIPNLLWQYNHNYPVLHHMDELQRTQLQYISPASFLLDQLLMNFPCAFIWIMGLLFTLLAKKGRNYMAFFFAYCLVIILLLVFHGKNYYALGLYPVLFAFGAYQLEKLTLVRVKIARFVFITIPFYFGLTFTPLELPMFEPDQLAEFFRKKDVAKLGVLKWEDQQDHPLPQDFSDMLGWKEITEKTARVYNNMSEKEKNKTIIKCDNYGLCGALNFYGKQMGLPQVYSTNASFLLWMPDKYDITNVITVGEDFPDTTRSIVKQFANISVKDELRDSFARENGAKIILWEHSDAALLSKFLEDEVAEKKKAFLRQ